MELVYLWVEDYKNIKNQGFNFSPNFQCDFKAEYDENGRLKDNCELIINPKENQLKDFFGKNINITAIVGENGSGKSSLFNIILDILEEENIKNYILVYYDKDLKYISNLQVSIKISKDNSLLEHRNVIVYINKNHKEFAYRKYNIFEIDKLSVVNMLVTHINKVDLKFNLSSFMYIPTKVKINMRDSDSLINEHLNFFLPRKKDKVKKTLKSNNDKYILYLNVLYISEFGSSDLATVNRT